MATDVQTVTTIG